MNEYVSVFSDISERKNQEKKLAHLATHDSLTSLPNRMHFNDNLHKAIQIAKRNNYKIAVLFLDLNRFKEVNDTMGHEIAQKIIRKVSEPLNIQKKQFNTLSQYWYKHLSSACRR